MERGAGEGGSGRSDNVCRSVYVRMCGGEEQSCLFVRSSLRAADADSNDDDDDEGRGVPRRPSTATRVEDEPSASRPANFFARLGDRDRRTERYLAIVSGKAHIDAFLGPTCGSATVIRHSRIASIAPQSIGPHAHPL